MKETHLRHAVYGAADYYKYDEYLAKEHFGLGSVKVRQCCVASCIILCLQAVLSARMQEDHKSLPAATLVMS